MIASHFLGMTEGTKALTERARSYLAPSFLRAAGAAGADLARFVPESIGGPSQGSH